MSPEDGLPARILELGEELRREGVAVGTSELLDAFEVLREISWTSQEDFREALAATLAKSQEDRRVFELVFERFFFRASRDRRRPARACARRTWQRSASSPTRSSRSCARRSPPPLRDGSEGAMRDLARMAIAAFARRQEGSGVIGVDVQRIRRALGLRAEPQPELPPEDPRRDGLPRDALRRFEALLRRELERAQIERTGNLPPARPLGELDRALPSGPLADLAAVHRVVAQLRRRLATQGMQAAATAATPTSTCGARCARRCRPAACRSCSSTARGAPDARRSTCCATSPPASPRRRCSSCRCCTRCTTRSARCARSCSSSASPRSPTSSNTSATSRPSANGSPATPASPTSPATPTTGACGRSSWSQVEDDLHPRATVIVLGDARTNGRDPRADIFAQIAARAGRTFWLNPEPRLYWNYGDSVIAAYEQYCTAFECWTTAQLEDFVRALARPGIALAR